MKRFVQFSVFAALVVMLMLLGLPASSAFAFDPPWPPGIPWPTTMPWPTANPLKVGVPWSPGLTVYVPTPTPTPVFLLSPASNPAPILIAPASNKSAPTPLPPIVPPPNPSASMPSFAAVQNPAPAPIVPASTAATGSGSSQSDALLPDDTSRSLGSGATVWYLIGTGGVHMDVYLDSNPASGMSMAIFAPNGSDKPIGRGTSTNANAGRLIWSGGNWRANGNWYALITNGNPYSVQYKVSRNQMDIVKHECHGYWEYIGTNYVFWTICD
jgi:hypothetical protein